MVCTSAGFNEVTDTNVCHAAQHEEDLSRSDSKRLVLNFQVLVPSLQDLLGEIEGDLMEIFAVLYRSNDSETDVRVFDPTATRSSHGRS